MTAVDAPLGADVDFPKRDEPSTLLPLPPAPGPQRLTRTTPSYAIEPAAAGRVRGVCAEHGCNYRTESFSTAGFLAGVFSAHGLVLGDEPTPGIPVCPSVLEVQS